MLTKSDLIRRARAKLDDIALPYLWSDSELADYINDSLIDASIRANLTVEDNIPIVFTQSGTTWLAKYALPSGILDVRSVYLASDPSYTLTRTSMRREEQLYHGRPIDEGTPWGYALDKTKAGTGDDADLFVRSITFIGTPTAADTAYLDVSRLPCQLVYSTDVPEIDPMFQPELLFGVAGLAYLKRDSDTYDPERSKKEFAFFEERFGPRLPAVVLRERQTEVPHEMIIG